MPPWENYQSQPEGPWSKYAAPELSTAPVEPEASAFDKRVGSWAGRTALGIASPILAGMQVFGGDSGRQVVADLEAAKRRGMKAEGKEGFDWYGLAGSAVPGSLIAKGVSSLLPAATSTSGRVLAGGLTGGAAAAASPVTTQGDFATEKVKQIGMGSGLGAAVPLVAQALMGAKAAIEPFYHKGREAIIGRTLNAAAGGQGPQVANALVNARELVPGSQPTVAQASQNAGISGLERATATLPEVKVPYHVREAAQNEARTKALRAIGGDDQAMAAAEQARKAASQPLIDAVMKSNAEVNPSRTVSLIDKLIKQSPGRTQLTSTLENVKRSLYEQHPVEQRGKEAWQAVRALIDAKQFGLADTESLGTLRTVLSRVKDGKIDADEALDQLKGMKGVNQAVTDIIQSSKDALKAPDQKLRSNAGELYQGARKNITDLLAAKAGDGSPANAAVSRELSIIMKSLDHQINKAEPAFGKYLQAYTEGSKPINQMDVARTIADKSINKLTDQIQPNAYANALSDKTAQQATGFKRATLAGTMTPQQMQTLQAVKEDLARSVTARNIGGTRGSDTVQNLAYNNILDRAGVPTFLRELGPMQIAGNVMARGADAVYGRANKDIAHQLAMTMLNPQEAGRVMQQTGPSRFAPFLDALVRSASGTAGMVPANLP